MPNIDKSPLVLLVHVPQTWPLVLAGEMAEADAILGDWAGLSDEQADLAVMVAGVFENRIVSLFDTRDEKRWEWVETRKGQRRRFLGEPTTMFDHLVGNPNPGWQWRRGAARPVQVVDLHALDPFEAPAVERGATPADPDRRVALVNGFELVVSAETATLRVPAGRTVTVSVAS